MAETTTNQTRTLVTKGTRHVAIATSPDVCYVKPGDSKGFPNWVEAKKLGRAQTVTVLIDGQPVMVKPTELGPPSDPAHEGKLGGIKSKAYRGHAMALSYSQDCFMEGEAVVRNEDATTHNHTGCTPNTEGVLVDGILVVADLIKQFGRRPEWIYCNWLSQNSDVSKKLVAAAKKTNDFLAPKAAAAGITVTPEEVVANMLSEGGEGIIASGGDSFSGFGSLGVDHLVSNYRNLKQWLPQDLQTRIETEKAETIPQENPLGLKGRKDAVTLSEFNMDQALGASGAMYAYSKAAAARDMRDLGVNINDLPPEGQMYWAGFYYNSGEGNGRKWMNKHGVDLYKKPYTQKSTTGSNPHANSQRRTASYMYIMRMCAGFAS